MAEGPEVQICLDVHEPNIYASPYPPTASPTPSLLDLSNELNCVSWHSLGVKLGLEGHQLRAIEEGHHGNNERLKNEMFDLWLRSAKNPSWKAIVEALRLMEEHSVADRIQRKYCNSTTTEVPTNGDQSDHLSVTSSVSVSARVDPLVSIQRSFVGSSGRQSGRGRGKGRGKNRTFSTPKNGKAAKPGLITEDAPEDCIAVSPPILSGNESTPEPGNDCSTDTEFPDLSPKTLSDFELGRLKFTLKKASQEIVIKFASLEHNTISMLRERKVPLNDVKNYVLSLGTVYTESAYKGKPLLLQQEDKIESTDDFGPLFLILKLYYSWFNYHIIEALRKEFLFHENIDEQLDKYKSDLHDYCRRRCFECPKDMFSNSSAEGFVSLCFKINDEFEMYSLNHVKQFQYSLPDILGLPNYTFQLCDVTDGCVTVVFRIPSQLADVITISSEQQQKLLLIGVKQLRIMTRIVFEEQDFSSSQLQQKVTGDVTTSIEQLQMKLEPPVKSLQTCTNMNQLHSASKRGDFEEVTSLLTKKECDINALNTDGESSLHIACKYGYFEIVKVLLKNQLCDLITQNRHGDTPLHLACNSKSLAVVRLLLEKKCSTNIPNKKGETAQNIPLNEDGDCLLHIACQWGDVDIVKYLIIDERCDPNIQTFSGNTPLHIAVKDRQDDTIVQLLSHKECDLNIQNREGDAPLHIAVRQGKTTAISQLLVNQLSNPNVQNREGDTPLHIACYKKALHVVRLLLERKCSTDIPNKKGETAQNIPLNEDGDCLLHIACQWGDVNIVKYLIIDERCNSNVQSSASRNTPAHVAIKYGQDDTILQLLSCDPNAQNKEGDTPLHFAVRQNKTFAILWLLSYRQCNLNVQNRGGDTPLNIACYNKSLDIIKHLLERKCSTNIPNKKGETAQNIPLSEDGDCLIHIACQWGDVDIVKYLITDERCNPNLQASFSKNAPLHIAVKCGQDDTIVQLLSHKECDLNIQNREGDAPLHIAVRQGKTTAISQLLIHSNLNVQNREGDTPLHIACFKKTLRIVRLLLEMRCSTNIPNKKGETAQKILLNEDGDRLLHVACQWGDDDLDIVRYLITGHKSNLNVQSFCLNTPLHIVCYTKSLRIVRLLLERRCSTNIPNKKGETAQCIPLNEDGDCLLHIACQWGDVDIVKYLITDERCDPNFQSSTSENTPLHIAARYGQDDLIAQLLSYKECNPNAQNKEGDTPLHFAVGHCRTTAISQLLAHQQCNSNAKNKEGDTPLHTAAKYGQDDAIAQLLSNKKCDINAQNKDGDTPLHFTVKQNKTTAISQLLAHQKCDPNVPNTIGDTPLHSAVWHGHDDTIVKLLSRKECNPNAQNNQGDTPLHIIAKTEKSKRCVLMITDNQCDLNILNNDRLTPLLIAIKHYSSSVATALLQHRRCDCTLCDPHGNTPLHLACISGETQPEMVEVAKQLLISVDVDPSCVNSAGQTPIELTTNYQLIQAISHMVQCKTKQSIQTYINMFIVGDPETGKSTLVKAISKEATSILWKIVPKQLRRVKNVPLHTAGIIPTVFRSKTFGNTVLYDLAGQVEYYTSHAAVIRSTVISTPPAFIVVVNLTESEEKISQTLRYWWSFIDNHAAESSAPPQVILVGSHADIVKSTGGSVREKMTQISALLKELPASFYFAGQVALDCRDPASRKLKHFSSLVNQSCSVLRQTADVDLRCHVLYAFLLERFQGKVACTVSDVATSIKETTALLPQNPDGLIPLLSTLSDKGLLLLVKGGESHGSWWVILQKQGLLGEINGTIFAPKSFRQHKDFSWSTGVVPFFTLKYEFPDYNPNMVSEFLTHLEFCFKIEDHQTLVLLKDEATNVDDTSPDVSEEYYFFPALVSVENPLHIWEENDNMGCKCGWFYQCIRPDQFLTTQFLHVLILRLAFTFALKLDPGDCREDSLFIRRKCSVWKHGIGWLNWMLIETVVEVRLQHQSVIVMMRCPKDREVKCAQLRSKVIQKILEVKDEHCKAVKMSESFIHPSDVRYPFTDSMDDVKFYSLTEIARGIIEEANALDQRGRSAIPVQDLLLFDPYTSSELLRELFSEKHSMEETVRSQVLETLNTTLQPDVTQDVESVSIPLQVPVTKEGRGTVQDLSSQHLLVTKEERGTVQDSSQHCTKPTLLELLRFTCADKRVINIPVEIATKYVQFGAFLLDDRTGSRVKIMAHKHHYDAEEINTEILQEWLTGRGKQPVNWATLTDVLHDIELSTLAGEIEAVKCPAGPVSN